MLHPILETLEEGYLHIFWLKVSILWWSAKKIQEVFCSAHFFLPYNQASKVSLTPSKTHKSGINSSTEMFRPILESQDQVALNGTWAGALGTS